MSAKSGMSLERVTRMRSKMTLFKAPEAVSDGVISLSGAVRKGKNASTRRGDDLE